MNLLRTTHGSSWYVVSVRYSLNGKGQSNLKAHSMSPTEGTPAGSHVHSTCGFTKYLAFIAIWTCITTNSKG